MPADDNGRNSRKKCFVMMPISDPSGYDEGHFMRVYKYIIEPAVQSAGFEAIRADDVVKTNYIVIDILKMIIESDMAICDLSGQNPNVMFELGVRQAFNKPVALIKDTRTSRIFDIQGLWYHKYDEKLRIASVEKDRTHLTRVVTETAGSDPSDVNSLLQLLQVRPAEIKTGAELSQDTSIMLSAIQDLGLNISRIERFLKPGDTTKTISDQIEDKRLVRVGSKIFLNGEEASLGDELYNDGRPIGTLSSVRTDRIVVRRENKLYAYSVEKPGFELHANTTLRLPTIAQVRVEPSYRRTGSCLAARAA